MITKRLLDPVAAALLLVLLAPLMLLIGLLIRLGSPGRAIFRQERAGRACKPFICYKFRTMASNVDPFGASPHTAADPRVTSLGRRLRETSLDELPQLFNILKGDMSLVGPRPLYMRQAAEWNPRQRRRLEVKPGLTGLAQVLGRGDLTIEEKLGAGRAVCRTGVRSAGFLDSMADSPVDVRQAGDLRAEVFATG